MSEIKLWGGAVTLAVATLGMLPRAAWAETKYWDLNGVTPGAGFFPNGTWDGIAENWSTSANGDVATTTWSSGDAAVFSAGTDATGAYTVTISAPQTLSGLTVEEGPLIISGSAINNLNLGANPARINQGATLEIPNFNNVATAAGHVLTMDGGTLRNTVVGSGSGIWNPASAIELTSNGGRMDTPIGLGGGYSIMIYAGSSIGMTAGTMSATLTKTGAGELRLRNTNTFTALNVQQGLLRIDAAGGSDASLGAVTGTVTTTGGALPNSNFGSALGTSIASTSPATRSFVLGGSSNTMFVMNANWTINGPISGSGGLMLNGWVRMDTNASIGSQAVALTLGGTNSYTGPTTINYGTLAVANGSAIPDFSPVALGSSTSYGTTSTFTTAVLRVDASETIGSLVGGSASIGSVNLNGAGVTLTTGGNNFSTIFAGVISGAGALAKQGFGNMLLTGTNTYSGLTTISGGTLSGNTIANSGTNSAFGAGAAFSISNGATLQYFGSTNTTDRTVSLGSGGGTIDVTNPAATLTANGAISGSGGLTKTGAGTLTVSSANTYSGGTTINGGKLAVNGSISGPVTINSGGVLGGSGTIVGNVTGGGRVAPGNSSGVLTINGDYTQNAASALEIEVGGLPLETEYDQLVVTLAANIAGRLDVPILPGFVPPINEITFLSTQAGINGGFNSIVSPNLASVNPGVALQVIKVGNDMLLRFAAPSTDIQFNNPDAEPAKWSEASNWTTAAVPGTVNVINLQNVAGTPQRINVEDADALVHQLNVTGNTGLMSISVQNGNHLSATVGTTVGNQAVIELDNGNLESPTVAVEGGGLLAGNGTVSANLFVGGQGGADATLRPGFSVGHLVVKGNYTQGAKGTLLLDVEGVEDGQFDTVDISGEATLGGTLRIDASNFTLTQPGEPIAIISAGSLTAGTRFADVETINNSDIFFAPIYSATGTGSGSVGGGASVDCTVGVCVAGFYKGDMNRNGVFDPGDVTAFALGLTRPLMYFNAYHIFGHESGNFDGFLGLDFDDIPGFRAAMANAGMSLAALPAAIARFQRIPEPASALLIIFGGSFLMPWLIRRLRLR